MSSYVRERVFKQQIGATRRRSKPFGLSAVEIVAALLTIAFFIVVLGYYFTTLKPEQDRLARVEKQLEQQQAVIITRKLPNETTQRDIVREALDSLESFKGQHLKKRNQGIITLFKEINAVAAKNGVKLSSGISMRDEMTRGAVQDESRSKSAEAILNQFASVRMDFTVAGQYQNLRSFISELERNKQFIIIDSIQLLSVEEIAGGGGPRRSQVSGIAVSIEFTAYFQS